MISIITTLITLFIGIEPLNMVLLNYTVTSEILHKDQTNSCKPQPISSNSKAKKAL